MERPRISVITVTYNCVSTIDATIQSVLSQNYSNLEYIIIDGGSKDGTMDIVRRYADRLAIVVSEPDKGIYDAMNKGVELATGDYIYFIGGDDTMFDGVLDKIVPQMTNHKAIYYGNVIMEPTGKRYFGKFNQYKILRKNICHQSIFFPRDVFSSGRRYSLKYKLLADYLLNLDLYAEHRKFIYMDNNIAVFKLAGASSSGDKLFVKHWSKIIYSRFSIFKYIYFMIFVWGVDQLKNIVRQILTR